MATDRPGSGRPARSDAGEDHGTSPAAASDSVARKSDPQVARSPRAGRAWVGIAANANSGMGSGRQRVERLVAELGRQGFESDVAWTPVARHELVARARNEPGCRSIVAVGGDGTVAALVNDEPSVPITVLRAGTENLFARHFGLSGRPEKVAATVATGKVLRIDLGRSGNRRFTLMAGIGFDADVVTRHHLARVGRAGVARPTNRAAYVEPVLRSTLEYTFPPLTVKIGDPGREETLVGTTAFIFNLPRYALGLPIAPGALADDGWLDLVVFQKAGSLQALRYLWLILRGVHLDEPGVEHRRVGRLAVTCAQEVPVQLDGDPGGSVPPCAANTPWTAEVLHQAIDVLVPASHPEQDN